MEAGMDEAEKLRKNAEACSEIAQTADSEPKKKRFERMARAWSNLADNQDWLDGDSKGPPPPQRR
jgi:hypothetical protein